MMTKLRQWRYYWCRIRGHKFVPGDVVLGFYEPDKLMPDGTIQKGEELEWRTMRCTACHPESR